jgi:hypothetical protein
MARTQGTTKRETVREDPPMTALDPSAAMYILKQADGSPLKNGNCDERFQYAWVNKSIQTQFFRFQALGYRPLRLTPESVRPAFEAYTLDEDRDEESNPIIERNEMILMHRRIELMHEEQRVARESQRAKLIAMGKIDSADARIARGAGARLKTDDDHNIHTL